MLSGDSYGGIYLLLFVYVRQQWRSAALKMRFWIFIAIICHWNLKNCYTKIEIFNKYMENLNVSGIYKFLDTLSSSCFLFFVNHSEFILTWYLGVLSFLFLSYSWVWSICLHKFLFLWCLFAISIHEFCYRSSLCLDVFVYF